MRRVSRKPKWRKILVGLLVVPVLLLLAGLSLLAIGDLARGPIERLAGKAIGRDVKIGGTFALDLLPSLRLLAGDVTIAGLEGAAQPFAARFERVDVRVDSWSLVSRPVRLLDVEIRGARVRLERQAQGTEPDPVSADRRTLRPAELREPTILLDNVRVYGSVLTYHEGPDQPARRFELETLEGGLDGQGMFSVDLAASFDSVPIELRGKVTPVDRLLQGAPLTHELRGRLGSAELTARGGVSDVAALRGIELDLEASGPEIAMITDLFDLPITKNGPFRLSGSATPADAGVEVQLDADLVELKVSAGGRVDSLTEPREAQLHWDVSGPDLRAAGAPFGWDRLPAGAFELSGRLLADRERTTLDRLGATVGDARLSVEGVVRTTSSVVDDELEFVAEGPDLSLLSSLAGADLPAERYRLAGHLRRRDAGIEVARLAGTIGEIDLEATGTLAETLRWDGVELDIRIAGPDLAVIRPLTGLVLPAGDFELAGHLKTGPSVLLLRDVVGRAVRTKFRVDGELALRRGLVGTELVARVTGPDPSWLIPLTGLDQLPLEPYEIAGRLRLTERGYELQSITGEYGSNTFDLDGRLGRPPTFDATDLQFRVAGEDPWWMALTGLEGIPGQRFDLEGRVQKLESGYRVHSFEGSVGNTEVATSGTLGLRPMVDGSDLEFEIRGPDLSILSSYLDGARLPAAEFALSGRLRTESGTYRLEPLSGEVGDHRFRLHGTLAPQPQLIGSDLTVELSGPNLADAARLAREAGLGELSGIPQASYGLSGHVGVAESGFEIEDFLLRLADAEARVAGTLGHPPDVFGTDLSLEAHGSDASILPPVAGKPLPQVPFSVRGRVERERNGARFHDLGIELGPNKAAFDGSLGNPPDFAGTNLDLRIEGPDLSWFRERIDWPLPDGASFEITAHLDGSPEQFVARELRARVGRSDLGGSLQVDLRGDRPALRGELSSSRIDLVELRGEDDPAGGDDAKVDSASGDDAEETGMLLSDEPLGLDSLNRVDANLRWAADQVQHTGGILSNTELELELSDGRLRVDSGRAEGQDGSYSISLDITPTEEEHRVELHARAEKTRIGLLPYSGDPGEIAPIDLELDLVGTGRSLHSLLASADGRLRLVQGAGKIDKLMKGTGTGALSAIYDVLRPFSEDKPDTSLECGVFFAELEDGVASLDPLALRTDAMVMVGHGNVDLGTERLTLQWAIKPRKGIGLSASAITNSYIKLGGTLSKPHVSIKPLSAVRDTGLAVFTGGLSLLGRAVFNRATADRNVCRLALEEEEKRAKKEQR